MRTWARDGITFILEEALVIVGVRVTPSIGSTSVRSRGSSASMCIIAVGRSPGSSPSTRSISAGASVSSNDSG